MYIHIHKRVQRRPRKTTLLLTETNVFALAQEGSTKKNEAPGKRKEIPHKRRTFPQNPSKDPGNEGFQKSPKSFLRRGRFGASGLPEALRSTVYLLAAHWVPTPPPVRHPQVQRRRAQCLSVSGQVWRGWRSWMLLGFEDVRSIAVGFGVWFEVLGFGLGFASGLGLGFGLGCDHPFWSAPSRAALWGAFFMGAS